MLVYIVICCGMLCYCVHILFLYDWISLGILVMIQYIQVGAGLFYSNCYDVAVCFCMLCSLLDVKLIIYG